jgi:hypothetical protein
MTGQPFYWVHPYTATLEPGDRLDLQICCHVDETWARRLTAGEDMNGASITWGGLSGGIGTDI